MNRSLVSVLVLFCGLGLVALPVSGEAQPTVTLITDDAVMAEAGQEPGQFSVHRSNDGDTSLSLNVFVERSGSAIIGTDYTTTNLVHTGGTTYYVSIPPNQLSQSVILTPVRDNIIESVEDISFILTGPLSVGHDYTIGASTQGDFTISDDVAEVILTVDDASAAEAGQDTAGFTVTRTGNGNPAGWMNVFVERSGSAIIGTDYTTTNLVHTGGTTYYVSIPPNQLSQSVILTPVRDNIIESVEDISFILTGPLSVGHDYTIGASTQGDFTISDDVAEVILTVDDASAAEAGQDTAGFTVTRTGNGNPAGWMNVFVERSGSAIIGTDYTTTNLVHTGGTTYYVSIPPNQLSQSVILTPVRDNIIESVEDISFILTGPLSVGHDYTIGASTQGDFTISDDVAEVILTVDDASAAEAGQDTAGFTVTRTGNGNPAGWMNVFVERSGSAIIGTDYTTTNLVHTGGTTYYVSIPPNQLSQSVILTPVRDNIIESVEDISFILTGPLSVGHDYTIGASTQGDFTISDDVAEVILTVDDASAAEAGQDTAGFTVTRTGNGNPAGWMNVFVERSGSAIIGTDYTTTNLVHTGGTTYYVSIPPNQLSQSVILTPVRDNIIESVEDISFILTGPLSVGQDYTIGASTQGDFTISDDVAEVILTVDDASAAEAGQDTAGFTVTRTGKGNPAGWMNVFVERSGSAIIGTDYTTTNLVHTGGTTYYVSIPPNQLSQSVTLTPVRDNIIESVEDISFILTGPLSVGHDYTIGASTQGDFTISDDVAEVILTVDDASAAEAGQDTAGFTVTRTGKGNPAGWMNVFVERSGSAIIGTDYTTTNLVHTGGTTYYVSIPPNQLSQSVILTPVFDEIVEGDETAGFKLLGPLSVGHDYTIGIPDQGEILILDFVDGIFADSFED